jgi:hypothetical protein
MSSAYIDQELYDSGFILVNLSSYMSRMGQRVNGFCGTIDYVKFFLKKYGTLNGTMYARVRKVSDDSIIGTLGSMNANDVGTTSAWYTFGDDVVVSTPTDIRITCEYIGGSGGNYIYYWCKLSDVCLGCESHYPQPGTGWVDDASYDSTIIVYASAGGVYPIIGGHHIIDVERCND